MNKLRTWREYLIKDLSANRMEAIDYIRYSIEEYQNDNNVAVFLLSLKTFIESQGGMIELAKRTHMSPDAIQKILSSDNAPDIELLCTILNALGCRLSIQPLEATNQEIKSTSEDQRTSAAG